MIGLGEIERFCARHGISKSQFGWDAIGSRSLVPGIRSGREIKDETTTRIRAFMAAKDRELAA